MKKIIKNHITQRFVSGHDDDAPRGSNKNGQGDSVMPTKLNA
jgi:hypothetical protein